MAGYLIIKQSSCSRENCLRLACDRPMKRPETVQDKWKINKERGISQQTINRWRNERCVSAEWPQVNKSIKGHQEAGFPKGWPSRFDTQFKLMKVLGFVYYEWGKPINFSQTGNYLADTVSIEIDSGAISREIVNPQNEQIAFMQAFCQATKMQSVYLWIKW